jgi:hypothetical protein
MYWGGISCITDETVILLWLGRHCLVCGNGVVWEVAGDCWVGEAMALYIAIPFTPPSCYVGMWRSKGTYRIILFLVQYEHWTNFVCQGWGCLRIGCWVRGRN